MESLRGVQTVRFEAADGAKLFGVEMGRGPRGLVLLHGSAMAGICDWSTGLDRLVADGFHLLAFDQRCYGYSSCPTGHGMDLDVRAAVEQLRDLGARSVVGIGGNQGSSVMLAAAAWRDSGMDAVVALSGGMPQEFYTGPRPLHDPVALAGRIDVPVLFASGRDDEGVVDQDRYRAAFRATGSPQSEYVVLPRGGHAMSMLGLTEPSAFYRRAFLGFLIEHSFSKRRDGR